MGATQSTENTQKLQLQQQQFQYLIPGLPNEIAMECLVRVPYQFHSNMKSVCQSWRYLISHPSFYQQRRRSSTAEHLVCLVQPLPSPSSSPPPHPKIKEINNAAAAAKKEEEESRQQEGKQIQTPPVYGVSIYNATHQTWHRTSWPNSATLPMFCQCVALPSSGKLLVLGGWDISTLEPVPDVYVLDLFGGGGGRGWCWRRAAPMSVARSFFASAVVGPSRVYVAGGHDNQKNALRSAEVYDVDKDEWRTLPAMAEERDECQGMSWVGDSKFWVVSGYGTDSQGRFRSDAECYDPAAGSWSTVHGVWPFSTTSPRGTTTTTVTAGKQQQWWWFLGAEQQQQQRQQQDDDVKERRWKVVSSIPIPNSMIGTSTSVCVVNLETDIKDCNEHRIFVMGGSVGRGASTCVECEGEGAFILEKDNVSGKTKWNHIHTPPGFSAFPFSASYLQI